MSDLQLPACSIAIDIFCLSSSQLTSSADCVLKSPSALSWERRPEHPQHPHPQGVVRATPASQSHLYPNRPRARTSTNEHERARVRAHILNHARSLSSILPHPHGRLAHFTLKLPSCSLGPEPRQHSEAIASSPHPRDARTIASPLDHTSS